MNASTGVVNDSGNASIPAVLTFSFTEAKAHLIAVDARFSELFEKLKCKPFEEVEVVNPFRFVCKLLLASCPHDYLSTAC